MKITITKIEKLKSGKYVIYTAFKSKIKDSKDEAIVTLNFEPISDVEGYKIGDEVDLHIMPRPHQGKSYGTAKVTMEVSSKDADFVKNCRCTVTLQEN